MTRNSENRGCKNDFNYVRKVRLRSVWVRTDDDVVIGSNKGSSFLIVGNRFLTQKLHLYIVNFFSWAFSCNDYTG